MVLDNLKDDFLEMMADLPTSFHLAGVEYDCVAGDFRRGQNLEEIGYTGSYDIEFQVDFEELSDSIPALGTIIEWNGYYFRVLAVLQYPEDEIFRLICCEKTK